MSAGSSSMVKMVADARARSAGWSSMVKTVGEVSTRPAADKEDEQEESFIHYRHTNEPRQK